jgi:hypothetical protein
MVREYLSPGGSGPGLDAYLETFRGRSLAQAIERAGYHGEYVHPHQRRLGKRKLARGADALIKRIDEVEGCRTFDELHQLVADCTKPIRGFGVLARYDVALRIGANLGMWPERVYLHAGTKVGCRKLGVLCPGKTIELAELPKSIRQLAPHHAENLLCVYKSAFGEMGRATRRERGG